MWDEERSLSGAKILSVESFDPGRERRARRVRRAVVVLVLAGLVALVAPLAWDAADGPVKRDDDPESPVDTSG